MGKRHEKGVIAISLLILLSLFLIYFLKDISPDMTKKENAASSDISVVTNDISMTDLTEQNALKAEQDDLWILFDYLIYARNESTVLSALFPAILICYIILIGPVIYFTLKKRDKMEWMWILLPAISLIFAGLIAVCGRGFLVKSPIIDSLTVVTPKKDDVVYFTSTSPVDKEYDLVYDERVKNVMPVYEETLSFSKTYTRLDVEANRNAKVECKFTIEDGVPVGTIENNTEWEFEHVMLCYKNYYCILPALSPKRTLGIPAEVWKPLKGEDIAPKMSEEMIKKDCDRILKIAYLKYYDSSQESQVQISAVIPNFESVIVNYNENLISYGLYQQWEQVK